jgi:hypothetical protein
MRGRVPLHIPAGVAQVLFGVESQVLEKAERVRPAWKLFSTWTQPRIESGGGGFDPGGFLLANAIALPLGFVVVPLPGPSVSSETRGKVEKPYELPPGFVAKVVSGEPEALDAPQWSELWRPGQPMPAPATSSWGNAPATTTTASPSGKRRTCDGCGFSGRMEDFAGDRFCPSCGTEWR